MPRLSRISLLLLLATLCPATFAQSYRITDLGTLGPPGADASSAAGINESGQVVGFSQTGLPAPPGQTNRHAFLWLPQPAGGFEAGLHDLGVLTGDTSSSFGWSVNSHLRVAGTSENGEPGPFGGLVSRATLWVEGAPTDLGNPSPGYFNSSAESLNEHDETVGSEANGFACKPLLWLPQPAYGLPAGVNILPVLPGHFEGTANDLNDAGEIVGRSTGACDTSSGHAVLWMPQPAHGLPAGLHDLTPEIPSNRFAEAVAISGNGKVAGTLPSPAGTMPSSSRFSGRAARSAGYRCSRTPREATAATSTLPVRWWAPCMDPTKFPGRFSGKTVCSPISTSSCHPARVWC